MSNMKKMEKFMSAGLHHGKLRFMKVIIQICMDQVDFSCNKIIVNNCMIREDIETIIK